MFQITSWWFNLLLRGCSRKNKKHKTTTNQIDWEKKPPLTKARITISVLDITTFSNELSKALEYKCFGDTCDDNDVKLLIFIFSFIMSLDRSLAY